MTFSEPQLSAVEQAAALWLLAIDRGLTDAEEVEFDRWLVADPSHVDVWAAAAGAWASFEHAPDPMTLSFRSSALSFHRARWTSVSRWAAAAAAAVLLAIGVSNWQTLGGSGTGGATGGPVIAASTYVAAGSRKEVVLPDGSRVLLDAHSRISVAQSSGRRDVALATGQAFFQVAHDAARPFVVVAGGRAVTATGTAFAVSLSRDAVSVVLAEGRVRVAPQVAAGPAVNLVPGQEYRASGAGLPEVRRVDVSAALSWREGFIALRNVTLRAALAQMNRGADHPVGVGDRAAGDLKVSGRFRADDPVGFAYTIAEIYPVRVVRRNGGAIVIVSASQREPRGEPR